MTQIGINSQNAKFWNELCGSALAQSLGITKVSPDNLHRFDEAYMAIYPYLYDYVRSEALNDKKVLEIGLGFGTLGQVLMAQGCDYYGLDIAAGPVAMMHYRLTQMGKNDSEKVQLGSALDIPYPDSIFDYVYSIGCLHHTGNLKQAVAEVYRILKPGGKAIVMLYNRHSLRQFALSSLMHFQGVFPQSNRYTDWAERVRATYDTNIGGEAAPYTEYVSQSEVKQLFRHFSQVRIDIRNFENIRLRGKVILRRERVLNNLGHILGLDLYIIARK